MKTTLKGSLGGELGAMKKIEKQDLNIPAVKETVTGIHKPQRNRN